MKNGTQPICTPRLLLRRFTLQDADAMYDTWATDPEVTRFMRWTPHKDVEETRATLESWLPSYQKDDYYHWAITIKETGQLIGSIGILYSQDPSEETGWHPGYCIGRAYWGKGYATEALKAVMDYFIKDTGITTLYCCHAVENPASGAVMQKVGFCFQREGVYQRFDGSTLPARHYIYRG